GIVSAQSGHQTTPLRANPLNAQRLHSRPADVFPLPAGRGRDGFLTSTTTAATLRARNSNPHVDLLPYPAIIFMNGRYGPKWIRSQLVPHEAGHVLGLAHRAGA